MTVTESSSTPRTEKTSTSHVRVSELASGGMGKVELALRREGGFRRLYAIKRLHAHLTDDPEFRAMFLDEARVAGLIQHPNVVSVLDVGEDDEGPFLLMDFVDGLPLSDVITFSVKTGQPLPVQTCVRVALAIARGLHAAHELRDHEGRALELVHRDLSPHNVLVGWDGSVRITDFGIAKALGKSTKTATGVVKGKMSYMSPEQLRYEETDRRSDLFALGIVLYEMLAGSRLYRNVEGSDGIRRILNEPPPDIGEERPEVPASLVALLFALLAKSREQRPATAAIAAQRLEGVLADLLAEEPPIETVAVVLDLAGPLRAERETKLRVEIAEAESREAASIATRSASPAADRKKRAAWPWVAALVGAAAAAAIALAGFAYVGGFDAAPEPSPSVDAQPTGETRSDEDESVPASVPEAASAPDEEPEAASAPDEEPEAASAPDEEPEVSDAQEIDRSTRRHRRRRRPAAGPPAMGAEPVSTPEGRRWDAWE